MIGIVILNYNEWDMTIKCINSIRKNCNLLYKVYVVDNNSPVRITKRIEKFFQSSKDVELIMNKFNKGYSAGNNVGIKKALDDLCDYVLISNNDVIFKRNSIENLYLFLKNHKEYGIVGPKVFLENGKFQEINMGCKMTMKGKYLYLLRKTPVKKISKSFVEKFNLNNINLDHSFDVYAVSGCCFMMSRFATKKLFPFDENTFLYEEENIIGMKMEKLKLKTCYCVDSEIIHLGGASTEKMSEFSYKCFIQSEQYYCKNYLNASILQRFPLLFIRCCIYIKSYGFGCFINNYLMKERKNG